MSYQDKISAEPLDGSLAIKTIRADRRSVVWLRWASLLPKHQPHLDSGLAPGPPL